MPSLNKVIAVAAVNRYVVALIGVDIIAEFVTARAACVVALDEGVVAVVFDNVAVVAAEDNCGIARVFNVVIAVIAS